ncbi:hypothetical protein [Portibacter lacus]|uniref:hypothetical protein n=1 Tax=Portibacter lacus TaxID=1099794 RepID=UPI001F1A1C2E|nr:hypothetical protein [Portibacter lacus]
MIRDIEAKKYFKWTIASSIMVLPIFFLALFGHVKAVQYYYWILLVFYALVSISVFVVGITKYSSFIPNPRSTFDVFSNLRIWTVVLCVVSFSLYSYLFILYGNLGGVLDNCEGKLSVMNHGELIRELTQSEYLYHKRIELLLFTTCFFAFFSAGQMILYKRNAT